MSNKIIIAMTIFQLCITCACLFEEKYWWALYWTACVTANFAILGINLSLTAK